MREILFRGKRKDTGEWIYGDLVHWWGRHNTKPDIQIYNNVQRFNVIHETIGQYTGLTDKNGNKIFEGDILQFDYIGKNLGVNGIAFVVFQNGKFGVNWGWHKEFVCLDGFANTTLEVIGNIHDNPELLGNE